MIFFFGRDMFSFLLNIYLGVELLSHMITLCLIFWETSKLFLKWQYYFRCPPTVIKSSNFCTAFVCFTIFYQYFCSSSINSPQILNEIPNDVFHWRSEVALHFSVNAYLASILRKPLGKKYTPKVRVTLVNQVCFHRNHKPGSLSTSSGYFGYKQKKVIQSHKGKP